MSIISDIPKLSAVESGRTTLHRRAFSPRELVRGVIDPLAITRSFVELMGVLVSLTSRSV